jgi:hypothetical protein
MSRITPLALLTALLSVTGLGLLPAAAPPEPAELPLLFQDDFSNGASAWEPTDPNAWKVIDAPQGKAYSQFQQSKYNPPYRSPFNFALIRGVSVGDFVLDARVQSTAKDVPHRDVCVIFNHQDPAHFYYTHVAKRTDDHANQIFIVNGAPRTKISTKTTPGTPWDDGWHRLRVTRTVADGGIAVYFDDLKTPIMTATDKTFTWGRVGLGSFDDTANWADVQLHGVKAEKK